MNRTELLRSAVAKLGPLTAANALTAFKSGRRGSWQSCVLARAYGADGELKREVRKRKGQIFSKAPEILGLSVFEAEAVVQAFDRKSERRFLRHLLEQEAAKMTATTAEEREPKLVPALTLLSPKGRDAE